MAGGPGTRPETAPAPASAPRADDPAPLTDDDIRLGLSRLPAVVIGELFHAIDTGQPLGPGRRLLSAVLRETNGRRARSGARETVTAVSAGLRIEVATPGDRPPGLITWQQIDGLLRPGATPARRQIVAPARGRSGCGFTSANASFRAVGEGGLARRRRGRTHAPTARSRSSPPSWPPCAPPAAAGTAARRRGRDDRRIAELAATLPARAARAAHARREVTPGDIIGHPGYRFHPFRSSAPPRQADDVIEITGRLTEPADGEPAGQITLTVTRARDRSWSPPSPRPRTRSLRLPSRWR